VPFVNPTMSLEPGARLELQFVVVLKSLSEVPTQLTVTAACAWTQAINNNAEAQKELNLLKSTGGNQIQSNCNCNGKFTVISRFLRL